MIKIEHDYTHRNDFALFNIPVGTPFMYKEKYYIKTNLEQNISEDKYYGIVDILTGKLTYEGGFKKVVWIDIDATVRIKTE